MIKSKSYYKNRKFTKNYQSNRIFVSFNRVSYKSKNVYQNNYQNRRSNKRRLKVIIRVDEKFKLRNRDFDKNKNGELKRHRNREFRKNDNIYDNDKNKNKNIDKQRYKMKNNHDSYKSKEKINAFLINKLKFTELKNSDIENYY